MDGWLNLTEIDPDEEVQGEIHLHISVLGDGDVPTRLRCQVMEARWVQLPVIESENSGCFI